MQRQIRVAAIGLLIIVGVGGAVLGVASELPSDNVLFLPLPAQPVAPVVRVAGEGPDPAPGGAEILYVAVREQGATYLESWLGDHYYEGADVVPRAVLIPPGSTPEEQHVVDKADMTDSQSTAAAVAERALGRNVVVTPLGARVVDTAVAGGSPARAAGIRAGDVIVAVDGSPITTVADLKQALAKKHPGDAVLIRYRAPDATPEVRVVTRAAPDDATRAVIGITAADAQRVDLPVAVTYAIGDVAGPSAGLAFALEIYRALGAPGLTRGHRVAVTGALDADGAVEPIGGVRQKAIGAADAQADVFLVPRDNLKEAIRWAPAGLKVIPVTSFKDALAALAALPER